MSAFMIGTTGPRIDAADKVRGSLAFPSDVFPRDVLHCSPVFAPYPHAELGSINTRRALTLPGVVRILTARDILGPNRFSYNLDRPILCTDRSRYEGDVVALVIAETEAAARSAAQLVEVEYSPLPLLTDPEQALLPGAPQIHANGNVLHEIHYGHGDPEAVFKRNDVVSVEHTYRPPVADHAFIETEAGVAFPENGGVRIVTCGQNAFHHQTQVASALGLPLEKVRVIEPYNGGAFGGKSDVNVQILIALAAQATGRPCRMVWTRHEHFVSGVKRHPAIMRLKTAATRDGRLLAMRAHVISDTGAYAVHGDILLNVLFECLTGPYEFPNVRLDAWSVYTNNYVAGAFRGFGANKGALALEGQISKLARTLGIDQVEFRKRNLVKQGGMSGIGHKLIAPIDVGHTLDAVARHPMWHGRTDLKRSEGPIRRGIGLALAMKGYGIGIGNAPDFGAAELRLGFDGRIRLANAAVDMGQGVYTALAQIAAESLRTDVSLFDVCGADTQETEDVGTTAASRMTYASGRAVIQASQELESQIRRVAAEVLQISPDEVEVRAGAAHDRASGRSLTFAQVAQAAEEHLTARARVRAAYSEEPATGGLAHPHVLYSSNAQLAQVAVDTETGQVTVERMVAFPEVGRVINRHGVEGQCEGGISQGLGYALMEQILVKGGRVQNADLATYPIPTTMDVPEMETVLLEVAEPTGPFGAKGAGENATVPTAPAILDAIEDAIGIRFTKMPVLPEQIIAALAQPGPEVRAND